MNIRLTRRELIQKSLAGFGALSLPVALTYVDALRKYSRKCIKGAVFAWCLCGDPLHDRIILWTRVTPSDMVHALKWFGKLPAMRRLSNSCTRRKVQTSAAQDFTVKVWTQIVYRQGLNIITVSALYGFCYRTDQNLATTCSDQVKFAVQVPLELSRRLFSCV